MPKSKREKKISLTKTQKKVGLEFKQALVDKVRSAVDNYARLDYLPAVINTLCRRIGGLF